MQRFFIPFYLGEYNSEIKYEFKSFCTEISKGHHALMWSYLVCVILNFLLRRVQVSSEDPDVRISCCNLRNKTGINATKPM